MRLQGKMPWKANAKMSQIKLKRFFFRSGCALRGGLAGLPPPLAHSLFYPLNAWRNCYVSKQVKLPDRQTDWEAGRQAGRQRVSHYVYAACDDDNKKHRLADAIKTEAASATPTRWHAPAVVFIWQKEIEKEREREGEIYLFIYRLQK